jgi:hypothetical protein
MSNVAGAIARECKDRGTQNLTVNLATDAVGALKRLTARTVLFGDGRYLVRAFERRHLPRRNTCRQSWRR